MKQKISLKEALCGFTFDFTYLNGKKMSLTNTGNLTIIKPGYQKVIPNMGITRENNTGRFIVHFDIEFPSELSEEVREQLNAILV
jgi:DnaJ-class molecular chaperone